MISYEEAYKLVMDLTESTDRELIALKDCPGRILLEDINSKTDMPSFDRSAMDGYALRSEDTPSENLKIIGESIPGTLSDITVGKGECVKISTGAPVPMGADAVQMVEKTIPAMADKSIVVPITEKGRNICFKGEDIRKGELLLREGCCLNAARAGLLASNGNNKILVGKKPQIAYCSTGNELVGTTSKLMPGQIRNSNSSIFSAFLASEKIKTVDLGIVGDDRVKLKEVLVKGLKSDVLITSGGVSMGERDYVKDVLRELGVSIIFDKVSIKPGKPTVFGKLGKTMIFSLPGNPVSATVTFFLFVLPAIRKMQGCKNFSNLQFSSSVVNKMEVKNSGRTYFVPAVIKNSFSENKVEILNTNGSGDLRGFSEANCIAMVPANKKTIEKGDILPVFPFEISQENMYNS